jgi:hypothetical protein
LLKKKYFNYACRDHEEGFINYYKKLVKHPVLTPKDAFVANMVGV